MVKKNKKGTSEKRTNNANKKSSNKSNKNLNDKLDQIIGIENKLLKVEKEVEAEEHKSAAIEKHEESEIEELERIEQEIKSEIGEHPLSKITYKDIFKGMVGSFIGLSIHYTFVYGVEISEHLSVARATTLFPLSFFVGLLFIYTTGFRKIKDKQVLWFMPIRLIVLYVCAITMSIVVLYLFYPNFGHSIIESYKMVAGVMLAAVVGACTADLLGKE